MFQLVYRTRPVSQNNRRGKIPAYRFRLDRAFNLKYPNLNMFGQNENLYGIVYYLANFPTRRDSDNLSKPLWDALQGVLYENDNKIRLRIAGILTRDEYDNYAIDPGWNYNIIYTVEWFFRSRFRELIYIEVDTVDLPYYKFVLL